MTNSPTFDQQLAINTYWKAINGLNFLPGTADRFVRMSWSLKEVPKVKDPTSQSPSRATLKREIRRRETSLRAHWAIHNLLQKSAEPTLRTRVRAIVGPRAFDALPRGRPASPGEFKIHSCGWEKRMNALGPSDVFKSASLWRMRAEEARTLAEAGRDSEAKIIMLRIAAGYDRLAENVGQSTALARTPGESEDPPPSLEIPADAPASNSNTIWITASAYAAIFGHAPDRTEYDRLGRGYKIALETRIIDRLLNIRAFNDSWSDAILKVVSAEGGWPYSERPSPQTFREYTLAAVNSSSSPGSAQEDGRESLAAETAPTGGNASQSVRERPGAVEPPGPLSSARPRPVGLRAAMWVAVVLMGSILVTLAGIGTVAFLVNHDCDAGYSRNNCE